MSDESCGPSKHYDATKSTTVCAAPCTACDAVFGVGADIAMCCSACTAQPGCKSSLTTCSLTPGFTNTLACEVPKKNYHLIGDVVINCAAGQYLPTTDSGSAPSLPPPPPPVPAPAPAPAPPPDSFESGMDSWVTGEGSYKPFVRYVNLNHYVFADATNNLGKTFEMHKVYDGFGVSSLQFDYFLVGYKYIQPPVMHPATTVPHLLTAFPTPLPSTTGTYTSAS